MQNCKYNKYNRENQNKIMKTIILGIIIPLVTCTIIQYTLNRTYEFHARERQEQRLHNTILSIKEEFDSKMKSPLKQVLEKRAECYCESCAKILMEEDQQRLLATSWIRSFTENNFTKLQENCENKATISYYKIINGAIHNSIKEMASYSNPASQDAPPKANTGDTWYKKIFSDRIITALTATQKTTADNSWIRKTFSKAIQDALDQKTTADNNRVRKTFSNANHNNKTNDKDQDI